MMDLEGAGRRLRERAADDTTPVARVMARGRQRRHRVRGLQAAGALVVALAVAAGVVGSTRGGNGTKVRVAGPGLSTVATPSSTMAQPTTTSTSTVSQAFRRCLGEDLRISLREGQGAVGNWAVPIDFRNISATTCTLEGYPDVAWVTASGALLGRATRLPEGGTSKAVVLMPGQSAVAVIMVPTGANQQLAGCHSTVAVDLQVIAPGSGMPVSLAPPGGDASILRYCSLPSGAPRVGSFSAP